MPCVKRAISIDAKLDERAETERARTGLSRSKFHAMALNEYLKKREAEEMIRQINEAYDDGLDDEDRAFLDGAARSMARIWQREDTQS